MRLSEIIRAGRYVVAKSNPAKPAFKHMEKAVEQLGIVNKLIHDMREPEMEHLRGRISQVARDLTKIMVPLSQRARQP